MEVQSFYDKDTGTLSYVVSDEAAQKCAVIDPVLNFEMASGKISENSINELVDYIGEKNLELQWILETHVHADHISGANHLKQKLGGQIAIGSKITEVQHYWADFFNFDIPVDGSQFDRLLEDDDELSIGELLVKVSHTPGHTPACICYLIEDSVFVGDTIFLPHMGTARADFPGGSSTALYDSIEKLLSLPGSFCLYVGHDYPKAGETAECKTTVEAQKQDNIMVNDAIDKQSYIEKRQQRDSTLSVPRLLIPAIQANIQAGTFPKDNAGHDFLKIPLNLL